MTGHAIDQAASPGWPALLIRFFLVVLPAQVVGVALGGIAVMVAGVPTDTPWPSVLTGLIAGIVAGGLVGLLIRPRGGRLRPCVLLSIAFGATSAGVLFVIADANSTTIGDEGPNFWNYLTGVLLITAVQTLTAWAIWARRSARHRRAS